jgi:type IX secretion system PorP/SprF family membrane protein
MIYTSTKMKKFIWIYFLIGLAGLNQSLLWAQPDYSMTQFQNTPFLTNPAMLGSHQDIHLFLNYRRQPNVSGENFATTLLNGIYPFYNRNKGTRWGGLGLSLLNDNTGNFLRTNSGMLGFAFNKKVGNNNLGNHFISLGLQGGYFQRRIDLNGLTTSSQYINGGFNPSLSINELVENMSQSYATFSSGVLWYAMDSLGRQTAFLGISAANLNRPRTAFYDGTKDKLPHHFTVHGGFRLINHERFSVFPNMRWVNRSGNNQVNAGSWLNYHFLPESSGFLKQGMASIGLWYNFNDAFVGALQIDQPKYYMTLSFDLPTANTSNLWQGNNAFELTIGLKIKRNIEKRIRWNVSPIEPLWSSVQTKPTGLVMVPIPPAEKKPSGRPRTKEGLEDGAFRFKFNSSELDEASKILLDSVSQVLMEYPEAVIVVSGHSCDIGTDERNLALSKSRAEAVKKYLAEYDGIDPNRIKTDAFGESRPLVPNVNEENRKKNRRVAFKLQFP